MGPDRQKLIALAAALGLLGLLVAGMVVFGTSGRDDGPALGAAEGVLLDVRDDRLRLRAFEPVGGREEVEFAVKPEDAPSLHLAHLQTHVSGGQPVRVEYERVGDELVARAVFDLPSPGQ